MGDRPSRLMPQRALADILEPRAQEALTLVRDELRRVGLERQVGAGVVLTGGRRAPGGNVRRCRRGFGHPRPHRPAC